MKLILLNGPTGIGKSTIAQKVHEKLPLSFLLDIDAQRRYISGYRENRKESHSLIIELSLAIVDKHLELGHDVIIDRVLVDGELADKFISLGEKHGAETFEFVLNAEKEILIKRAAERGFREGSMLTPEKVEEFWEKIQQYIQTRPKAYVVDTDRLGTDETFDFVMSTVSG